MLKSKIKLKVIPMKKLLEKIFLKEESLDEINIHENDIVLRLMFEIAISDGNLDKKELALIKKRASKITSESTKISLIIKKIIDESEQSTSLYPTIEKINNNYSTDEKHDLLEVLWSLVTADSIIDPYEERLYFKIAELIKIKRSIANQIKQLYIQI
jgi:uncharacterized tellurite resistance protein B-like protein